MFVITNGYLEIMISPSDVLVVKHLIGINSRERKRKTTTLGKYAGENMNSTIIMVVVGATILATSTLAFGATLTTPLEFNLIGASNNIAVTTARANVTAIDFIQEVAGDGVIQTNGTIFTVGNEDPVNTHTFEICLSMEGPVGVFSPGIGTSPACTTTSSIPPNAMLVGQTIYIPTPIDILDLLNISVSIEETS